MAVLSCELNLERATSEDCKAMGAAKDAELAAAGQYQSVLLGQIKELQSQLLEITEKHNTLYDQHRQAVEEITHKDSKLSDAKESLLQLRLEKDKEVAHTLADAEMRLTESLAIRGQLVRQLQEAETDAEQLGGQLTTVEKALKEKQQTLHDVQAKLVETTEKLDASDSALVEATAALNDREIKLEKQLSELHQNASGKLQKVQQELASVSERLEQAQRDIVDQADMHAAAAVGLKIQLQMSQEELAECQNQALLVQNQLKEKLEHSDQEVHAAAMRVAFLETELDAATTSLCSVRKNRDEDSARATAELQALQKVAAELQQTCRETQEQVEILVRQIDGERAAASSREADLKDQIIASEAQHNEAAQKTARLLESLQQELDGSRRTTADTQTLLAMSKDELEKLAEAGAAKEQQHLEAMALLQTHLCNAELRVTASEAANDHLLAQITSLQSETAKLDQQLQQKTREHSDAVLAFQEEKDGLVQAAEQAEKVAKEVGADLECSHERLIVLQSDFEQVSHSKLQLTDELQSALTSLAAQAEQHQELTSQIGALTLQLSEKSDRELEYTEQLQVAAANYQNLSLQFDEAKAEYQAVESELAVMKVSTTAVQADNSSLLQSISLFSNRLLEMETEEYEAMWSINSLHNTLSSSRKSRNDLSLLLAAVQQQSGEVSVDRDCLAAQLDALANKYDGVLASHSELLQSKQSLEEQARNAIMDLATLGERFNSMAHLAEIVCDQAVARDAELVDLAMERRGHLDELQRKQADYQELAAQQAILDGEVQMLRAAVKDAAARETGLLEQQEAQNAFVGLLQVNLSDAQKLLAQAEEQLTCALNDKDDLERRLNSESVAVAEKDSQIEQLKAKSLEQQTIYEGRIMEAHLNIENAKLESLKEHEHIFSELQQALQRAEQLEVELRATQDVADAVRCESERLRAVLATTEDQLVLSQDHIASCEAKIQAGLKQLDLDRMELASKVCQLDEAKSYITNLNLTVADQVSAIDNIKQALAFAEETLSHERRLKAEQEQHSHLLENKLLEKDGELNTLTAQLHECQTRNNILNETAMEWEDKYKQQENESAAALQISMKRISEFEATTAIHASELASASTRESELLQIMENMRNEMRHVREALGAEQALRAQRDEEIACLTSELADVQNAAAKLHDEMKDFHLTKEGPIAKQGNISEYTEQLMSAKDEIVSLNTKVEGLQQELQRMEVEALQAQCKYQAIRQEAQTVLADSSTTAALEMQRLIDENSLLDCRVRQMEIDLQELLVKPVVGSSTALGHNNPKQPIQYHLRLKQELEEMRREFTLLVKDNFQLEQCIRYLAAASADSSKLPFLTEQRRSTIARLGAQPSSLVQSPLFATPLGRNSMLRAGRSRIAAELGTPWQSKADILANIQHTVHDTVSKMKSLAHGLSISEKENEVFVESHPASGTVAEGTHTVNDPLVEARILDRIAVVCSPHKKQQHMHIKGTTGKAPPSPIVCDVPVQSMRAPLSPANRDSIRNF
eukprot:jgi/Botrbrau1/20792/Bobra.0156s0022.1